MYGILQSMYKLTKYKFMFFYGALDFKPSIIIFADFSDSCISLSASSTDTPGSIFLSP